MGHQNHKRVRKLLTDWRVKFKDSKKTPVCEACLKGKAHRLPFQASKFQANKPAELIHADLCGPMEVDSIGNSRYFLLYKDDFSNFRKVYFIKNKSEVKDYFKIFLKRVESETGEKMEKLRTDNGLEFINAEVRKITEENGIQHEKTVSYSTEQNGRAEKENRTLVEMARTLLQARGLPKKLWAEAINTAAYILNNTGEGRTSSKTPHELWYGTKPNIELKVFGTKVYIHIPKQKRLKWDAKAKTGIFIGYSEESKGYRIWIEDKNKVEIHRDVFFETEVTPTIITRNNGKGEEIMDVDEVERKEETQESDNDVETLMNSEAEEEDEYETISKDESEGRPESVGDLEQSREEPQQE